MRKISIIIPIYNVEKYLVRCIDSVLQQKEFIYSDNSIEILLINDGSPDNSQLIIDKYVNEYSYIKGYYKENGGLSDARNYGLDRATGSYVWFIDSDDWISRDSFRILNGIINNTNAEIISFLGVERNNSNQISKNISSVPIGIYRSEEYLSKVLNIETSCHICFRIFKRSLFDNIKFPVGVVYEDIITLPYLISASSMIVQIDEGLYNYSIRTGSITGSVPTNVKGIIKEMSFLNKFLLEGKQLNQKEIMRYTYSLYIVLAVSLTRFYVVYDDVVDDLDLVLNKIRIKNLLFDKVINNPADLFKAVVLKINPRWLRYIYAVLK